MTAAAVDRSMAGHGFAHEALIFSGEAEFLDGTVPLITESIGADEPVLVAVTPPRIAALRAALGRNADHVAFVNMGELGANPGRIIPEWYDFLERNGNGARPVLGIGEPIWASRTAVELVECQRHEALLNVAFAGSGDWRLLCPYDADALSDEVLVEARRSHPFIVESGVRRASADCRDVRLMGEPFEASLPEPAHVAAQLAFDHGGLVAVRELVIRLAVAAGFGAAQTDDLALAVHEVAANSVLHAGGHGDIRAWEDGATLVCEIRDAGRISNPLAGRRLPPAEGMGGRGLWLANQLCDLVQIRTFPTGNVVRLHMHRRP